MSQPLLSPPASWPAPWPVPCGQLHGHRDSTSAEEKEGERREGKEREGEEAPTSKQTVG